MRACWTASAMARIASGLRPRIMSMRTRGMVLLADGRQAPERAGLGTADGGLSSQPVCEFNVRRPWARTEMLLTVRLCRR
jgi:hypothetical protein